MTEAVGVVGRVVMCGMYQEAGAKGEERRELGRDAKRDGGGEKKNVVVRRD